MAKKLKLANPVHPSKISDLTNDLKPLIIKGKTDVVYNGGEEIEIELSSGTGGEGYIDLEKYGIVQADFVEPFTAEMYEVAYNNGLGIQKAIDDAKAEGRRDVIVPAGNYPVCYSGDVDLCNNSVINACGVNLFGYGVKLYVIYDEDGINPYFTGETPRLLQGTIIATDSDVRGFHLVGERGYRVAEETKYREGSYGIGLMPYTRGNVIKDCVCELFSGDGIGCHQYMEQIAGWPDDTFTSIDWDSSANSFVESTTMWTSSVHDGTWLDQTKPLLLRCTGYFLYSSAPLRILCFDENDVLLGTVRFWQGEYFYLLPNTAKWYLQMVREVEHDVTLTETWSYWIGNGYYCDTLIENCKSRFNQRGGMSNLPTNTTVRNCEIHHNGCAYDGMPAFYDSTQFGIDIEDVFIHNISVEGCNIHGNLQGVLYRCWGIRFKDCYIQGYVNSLNSCSDFFAENTNFGWGCTMTSPTPFGSKTAIGCKFGGNVAPEINVIGKAVATASISEDNNTLVLFKDSSSEVLFQLDLTMLGKNVGDEIVPNALLFNLDLTKANADTLTITDETGNLSAVINNASSVVDNGVCNSIGNSSTVTCSWVNTPTMGEEYSIEMLCFGLVYRAMATLTHKHFVEAAYSGGITLTNNEHTINSEGVPNMGSTAPYINTSGESATAKGLTTASLMLEDGTTTVGNDYRIADLNASKYWHIVYNYCKDGTIKCYINGYPYANNPTTTDFSAWDLSELVNNGFYLWRGAQNTAHILKTVRMYNRCLTVAEIKNNLIYEAKKLGY